MTCLPTTSPMKIARSSKPSAIMSSFLRSVPEQAWPFRGIVTYHTCIYPNTHIESSMPSITTAASSVMILV